MPVPTDEEMGLWPMPPERGEETHQDHGLVHPRRAQTRAQTGRQLTPGRCLRNYTRAESHSSDSNDYRTRVPGPGDAWGHRHDSGRAPERAGGSGALAMQWSTQACVRRYKPRHDILALPHFW